MVVRGAHGLGSLAGPAQGQRLAEAQPPRAVHLRHGEIDAGGPLDRPLRPGLEAGSF